MTSLGTADTIKPEVILDIQVNIWLGVTAGLKAFSGWKLHIIDFVEPPITPCEFHMRKIGGGFDAFIAKKRAYYPSLLAAKFVFSYHQIPKTAFRVDVRIQCMQEASFYWD